MKNLHVCKNTYVKDYLFNNDGILQILHRLEIGLIKQLQLHLEALINNFQR